MDIGMVFLRLVHIFSGILWVGSTFFTVAFLQPAVAAAGPDGGKVMQWMTRQKRFGIAMTVAAILTTLAGVLMYWPVSGNLSGSWLGTARGLVLTIGAAAGLIAFAQSFAMQGRANLRMTILVDQLQATGGQPTPEQMAEMRALQETLRRGTRWSTVLMIIAVAGMAGSRYI